MVTVHDKCHAKGKDKDFAELVCLYKSSLHHKSVDGLHDARQHIHDEFVATRFVFKHEGEAARECRNYNIPSIDFAPGVLREAKHILKGSHVRSEEHA